MQTAPAAPKSISLTSKNPSGTNLAPSPLSLRSPQMSPSGSTSQRMSPPKPKVALGTSSSFSIGVPMDPYVPTILAGPFCSIISEVISSTCNKISERNLEETVQALEAQTYFAACKQLYSLMMPEERAILGPLGQVFKDQMNLPRPLAISLFSLLSLDTHNGGARIKHAPLLFKRWLAKGLMTFPCSPIPTKTISTMMWPDEASKVWLDEQMQPFCKADNAFGTECRRLRQQIDIPRRSPAFDLLGYEVVGDEFRDEQMIFAAEKCNRIYAETYSVIIEAVMKVATF